MRRVPYYLAMSAAERIIPSLLSSERLTMRLTPKLFITLFPSLPSGSVCPRIRMDKAGVVGLRVADLSNVVDLAFI